MASHEPLPHVSANGAGGATAVRATVRVGEHETAYRTAGAGRPILLLHAPRGADAVLEVLIELLDGRRRIIHPESPPPAPQAVSAWLRSLLDGLGLAPVGIVAHGELGLAALTFALLEPERVDRIALVQDDRRDDAVHQAALEDRLTATGHPLLVVRRTELQACPPAVREAVARFFGVTPNWAGA